MKSLCFSVRFLHSTAHGRDDGGEPEWPPSPLRFFQALVAAAAGRWNERQLLDYAVPALQWLESLGPPEIVAPNGIASEVRTQFYVPDNTAELLVPAFKRGEVDKVPKRTEKVVRPTHIIDGEAVHYVFACSNGVEQHLEILRAAARSITHLGWGIDMVAGDAQIIDDSAQLEGNRWRPVPTGGTPLRVPKAGTLSDLMRKHEAFLNRIEGEGFRPVPPLSCFDIVGYSCPTLQPTSSRPFVAFQILDPAGEKYKAFNTPRRARDVAAWVRHATGEVCQNWPFDNLASFVHGHDANDKQMKGELADRRFMYLPVPTIERRPDGNVTGAIRRVLIMAPAGCQDRIDWIRRRLPGQELTDIAGEVRGLLNLLPTSDWVLKQYTGQAHTWSTVTPVIWPGYDDRDSRKAEKLLRNAFVHAGISQELVDSVQELEWRHVGFRAGVDLAKNYCRPDHLTGSMFHVRVRFAQPVRGPLVVGAGRYRGFGLFAIDS